MADTSKYTAYKNKFQKENYDRINLVVPKGKKNSFQVVATESGKSLNGYILEAIEEKIQRDKQKTTPS